MREPKVTYQPIGRLGNQMFQCAAAIGHAKKYGVGWACPSDTKEVPRFHEFFPGLPIHDGHEFRRYNVADPSQFNYEPIPFNENGTKLVGFFQSEKYFEGAEEEIRKAFKLFINPIDAVSIHVRRGDYVQYSNSFPPITERYLIEAIQEIFNRTSNTFNAIVFSDDIQWCKDMFGDGLYVTQSNKIVKHTHHTDIKFQYAEGNNELKDLSLMASCTHHIIANSTFSWWGAWLGHNPDKIVVSPSADNWFGPGFTGGIPKDLIPPSWHQIKFR